MFIIILRFSILNLIIHLLGRLFNLLWVIIIIIYQLGIVLLVYFIAKSFLAICNIHIWSNLLDISQGRDLRSSLINLSYEIAQANFRRISIINIIINILKLKLVSICVEWCINIFNQISFLYYISILFLTCLEIGRNICDFSHSGIQWRCLQFLRFLEQRRWRTFSLG